MFRTLLRRIASRFFASPPPTPPLKRCRPAVEPLEIRRVLSQFFWTNAGGDFLASNPANYGDGAGGTYGRLPNIGDYFIFGGAGVNAPCIINTSLAVDRVISDSSYTSAISIVSGAVLTTNNHFQQWGTLNLDGTGSLAIGTHLYVNGTVNKTALFGLSTIVANGGVFLNGVINSVAITGFGPPVLTITSTGFDQGGTINVATALGTFGSLSIVGPFTQTPAAVTNVFGRGVLSFAGSAGQNPTFEGTINVGFSTVAPGNTVISSVNPLGIAGAVMNVTGANNAIVGNVGVYNSGVVNVGSSGGGFGNALTLTTGSLTVGGPQAGLPATTGTLNLHRGNALNFPADPTPDTFVITNKGIVNMYGAAITMNIARVAALLIEGNGLTGGELNSLSGGGMMFPDIITGNLSSTGKINLGNSTGTPTNIIVTGALAAGGKMNMYGSALAAGAVALTGELISHGGGGLGDGITSVGGLDNNGHIRFTGALHALALGGAYTQLAQGILEVRVANGGVNDALTVTGAADLAGKLWVKAMGEVDPTQTWTVLTNALLFITDFTTKIFPTDGGAWQGRPNFPAAALYSVTN